MRYTAGQVAGEPARRRVLGGAASAGWHWMADDASAADDYARRFARVVIGDQAIENACAEAGTTSHEAITRAQIRLPAVARSWTLFAIAPGSRPRDEPVEPDGTGSRALGGRRRSRPVVAQSVCRIRRSRISPPCSSTWLPRGCWVGRSADQTGDQRTRPQPGRVGGADSWRSSARLSHDHAALAQEVWGAQQQNGLRGEVGERSRTLQQRHGETLASIKAMLELLIKHTRS
ncbi:hypothetical protein [Gemmatimonas sp.]